MKLSLYSLVLFFALSLLAIASAHARQANQVNRAIRSSLCKAEYQFRVV